MRINSAAVALFFLIAIASQGSISCNFFAKIKPFISDDGRNTSNDDDIFDFDPMCQKFFKKVFNFFSDIFPHPHGVGGGLTSTTKQPGSSVDAGSSVSSVSPGGIIRPPGVVVGVRPPEAVGGVFTGPSAPVVGVRPPEAVDGVITGPLHPVVVVRPPKPVGGVITGPLHPVVGIRPPGGGVPPPGVVVGIRPPGGGVPPPGVVVGIRPPGGGVPPPVGGGVEAPSTVDGPIIPTGSLKPTGSPDANATNNDDVITVENDYPEIDYNAVVERRNTYYI